MVGRYDCGTRAMHIIICNDICLLSVTKNVIFIYHNRVMICVIPYTLQYGFHIIVYNTRKGAWEPYSEGFVTLLSKQKVTQVIVTGEV